MDFYEMIKPLKEALKREKLVIFVGAGVSKNSGYPTWGQMVKTFARKIDYPDHRLSTSEYIRIPQYYYGVDESPNHRDYYETLNEAISCEAQPNIINELIARIHPVHIITTNYDKLMDNVAKGYSVVTRDSDLLKLNGRNYLIKMHGDIDNLKEVVFKEEDYLQYSETHRLIEIFIKSLLIDHVFLFVGYSLNDYNFNTFTSWIEFLAGELKVKETMHKNFFLSSSHQAGMQYLRKYYESKGLNVIDMYDYPEELEEKSKHVPLEKELGRKTYSMLELLLEQ